MNCYLCDKPATNIIAYKDHSYIICDKCKPGCLPKIAEKKEKEKEECQR